MNALERGLTILDILAGSDRALGVTEIGAEIGVDKSSVHRLLATLTAHGYTEQSPETKRYHLSTKIVQLGRQVTAKVKLLDEAKPFVRAIALQTAQSAHLAVLRNFQVVYLDEAVPTTSLRVDVPVGGLAPAHCTALGKALLCELNDGELSRFVATGQLTVHTPRTISTHEALRAELATVRQRGYAVDDEEFHIGVRCIAAPVRDHTGKIVAAIGVSGPAQQHAPAAIPALAAAVIETACTLSHRLGFFPAALA
ncbi:MAG: IclR family transcriptional regulator [Chloroflexota bacterium]